MPYSIQLPDGRLVEGIPDEVTPQEAKRRIIAAGLVKAPETTVLGETKEFFKGLAPGAVGLVETAAVGASALLPEEYEKAAREKIASVAGAAKKPFEAASGYKESVGRKFGEAVGSTVPFLLAGPAGWLGRAGIAATAVASGAGEARQRAEQEGATAEQRATATALGTIPGAAEIFAPFRILSRVPDAATATGVQMVKRALVAGGEEAAQEAASNWAQNLIAKGVYKPEQELIEGLGEAAAYGGATGALIQGVMDLALGRRARRAAAGEGAEAVPEEPGSIEEARARKEAKIAAAREAKAAKQAAAPEAGAAEEAAIPPPTVAPAPETPAPEAAAPPELRTVPLPTAESTTPEVSVVKLPTGRPEIGDLRPESGQAPEVTEATPAAPAPETIPEPVVQKTTTGVAETTAPTIPAQPALGLTEDQVLELGLTKKQPLFRRLVNKDLEDPQQRLAVAQDVEKYLIAGNGNEDSRVKLHVFKESLLKDTTDVGQAVAETGGVGVSVAGEPSVGAAPRRTRAPVPSRVVPPAEDVEPTDRGEGQRPSAVETAPVEPPAFRAPPPTAARRSAFEGIAGDIERTKVAYSEAEEASIKDQMSTISAQIKDWQTAQKDLRTNFGTINPSDQPAYDEAQRNIDLLNEERAALKAQLSTLRKTKPAGPTKATERGLNYYPDPEQSFKEAEREIIQAVGAYNDPKSDVVRKQLSTDYLLGLAADTSRSTPEAARNMAKRALKNAIKPGDLRPSQQKQYEELTADVGPDQTPWGEYRFRSDKLGVESKPVENPISRKELERIVASAQKALGGTDAGISIVDSVTDMFPDRQAGSAAGVMLNSGRIVLFRDGIESGVEGEKTVFHEIFHRGLRRVFDTKEYLEVMGNLYNKSADIRKLATEWGQTHIEEVKDHIRAIKEKSPNISQADIDRSVKALVVEEVLATKAEDTAKFKPTFTRQVGAWLANIADRLGFHRLARSLRAMGLNPLEDFIRDVLREGVGKEVAGEDFGVRYSAKGEPRKLPTLDKVADEIEELAPNLAKLLRRRDLAELMDLMDLQAKTDPDGEDSLFWNRQLAGADTDETLGGQVRVTKDFDYVQVKGPKDLINLRATDKQREEAAELSKILNRLFNEQFKGKWDNKGIQEKLTFKYGLHPNHFDDMSLEYNKGDDSIWSFIFGVANARELAFQQAEIDLGPRFRSIIGERKDVSLKEKTGAVLGPNKVIGLRAKLADSLAGIDYIFTKAYANRIKDNLGNYNPVVLVSRALDYGRFANAAKLEGTAVVDPGGMIDVKELVVDGKKITYEKTVKSVTAEAKRLGKDPKQYFDYVGNLIAAHREYGLYQKHGPNAGIDFFFTPQELNQLEAEYQNTPIAKQVTAELNEIRFSMLDLLQNTGRYTEEQIQDWKDALDYMPFERIGDLDGLFQKVGYGTKSGVSIAKSIKSYAGSTQKKIVNPIESFADFIDYAVKESMNNEASRRALSELEMLGYAQFLPGGQDSIDKSQRGMVASTYDKGVKKEYFVPDPANYAAFVVQGREVPGAIRLMQKYGARVLRAGVTTFPPFAVKQIVDDVTRAYVYSGVKNPVPMIVRALTAFPINWFNEIRGAQSSMVRELYKRGIVASYDIETSTVKDIMADAGLAKRGIGEAIFRIMEAGAKASDVSIRQAIYERTMKETGDAALAEYRAREIINFSRRGSAKTMDMMIRIVPFFNAYARGMDKLMLAAAGNTPMQKITGTTTGSARALFHKRMAVLATMGLIYAILMSDDEEYQKLDDNVRDRNWILPAGKDFVEKYGFVPAISIPSELGFFFKSITERIVQYYKLQGTDEERDALRIVKELLVQGVDVFSSPNVTPQIIKPILENMANYSFFMGRPLESQMQLNLRPVLRESMGTSEIAKGIAGGLDKLSMETNIEAFQISPIKIDNLLRGLFGSAAGAVISMTDAMINPTRTDRPLHQQFGPQITGAAAFIKDGVGTRYTSDLYDLEKSVEQVYKSYRAYVEAGENEKAEELIDKNIGLYAIRGQVQGLMEQVRTINAFARKIDKLAEEDPEARREEINELRKLQNEIAKEVYVLRKMAFDIQRDSDMEAK